jgi:hypothetical protein
MFLFLKNKNTTKIGLTQDFNIEYYVWIWTKRKIWLSNNSYLTEQVSDENEKSNSFSFLSLSLSLSLSLFLSRIWGKFLENLLFYCFLQSKHSDNVIFPFILSLWPPSKKQSILWCALLQAVKVPTFIRRQNQNQRKIQIWKELSNYQRICIIPNSVFIDHTINN